MAIERAVAYSEYDDSAIAAAKTTQTIVEKLGKQPDIILAFPTVGHKLETLLAGIQHQSPAARICGCSTAGSLSHLGTTESQHGLTLIGLVSKDVQFLPFLFSNMSVSPLQAGKEIGKFVSEQSLGENSLLVSFPDGLTVSADPLFDGIRQTAGIPIDIVGGTSGNDYHLDKTFQFLDNTILSDAIAGLVITGQFQHYVETSHGGQAMGRSHKVTKAKGNRVLEVDGLPAQQWYKAILGQDYIEPGAHNLLGLTMMALGVPMKGLPHSSDLLVRALLSTDASDLSLVTGAGIPEGSSIRITICDPGRTREGSEKMAERLLARLKNPDSATFLYFNCAGRGAALFGESSPDVDTVCSILGPKRDLGGFFCFGEISPLNQSTIYHNYSGVLLAIE